ncbi:MAG: C69 family dipeptidase [Eggerthellaceae bacterium]|nr:C69 family dipeptidase [Eggerthellaceae bacterium]
MIADESEIWYFVDYEGYFWAAHRMPEYCCWPIARYAILGLIAMEDTDNFLAYANMIRFVKENNLDKEVDCKFSVSSSYGISKLRTMHHFANGAITAFLGPRRSASIPPSKDSISIKARRQCQLSQARESVARLL